MRKKLFPLLNLRKMNNNFITGIYPGTFDPVTFGHLDIIVRASHIVNKLIISVAENPHKHPFFEVQERIDMIKDSLKERSFFKDLRKEVEIGANGTQDYVVKKGVNKNTVATTRQ